MKFEVVIVFFMIAIILTISFILIQENIKKNKEESLCMQEGYDGRSKYAIVPSGNAVWCCKWEKCELIYYNEDYTHMFAE